MAKIIFTNNLDRIVQKDIKEAAKLAESYFHTKDNPDQLKTNEANFNWIYHNFPKS